MRYNNRRLNCATAAEKETTKIQLKEWTQRFFEEENIDLNMDFATWKLALHENTDGDYFASLNLYVAPDPKAFPIVTAGAKFKIGDTSAIATAAKDLVEMAITHLIFEIENYVEEQITLRLDDYCNGDPDDEFTYDSIDVRIQTPGLTGDSWNAVVNVYGCESADYADPKDLDADLEFSLIDADILKVCDEFAYYIYDEMNPRR